MLSSSEVISSIGGTLLTSGSLMPFSPLNDGGRRLHFHYNRRYLRLERSSRQK
ncbi:MAG: hypothetical protein ACTS68_00770 [Candidatus Hodgkinia cicadicola]